MLLYDLRCEIIETNSGLGTRMLLYYITDRRQFAGTAAEQRRRLLEKIAEAARCRLDFIQLREKDLATRELEQLAREAAHCIRLASAGALPAGRPGTRLLINSRVDVALAAGADGVHLRADDMNASDARALWAKATAAAPVIAVSCHTAEAVRMAESHGADFAVFAPVFEKSGRHGVGLEALRSACLGAPAASGPEASPAVRIAVLALGGVTLENARPCLQAGAAGIAAIRLFQANQIARVAAQLRAWTVP
jgi:thiamine-phosphate pyrophosphorylase